jgi:hypothetical protein
MGERDQSRFSNDDPAVAVGGGFGLNGYGQSDAQIAGQYVGKAHDLRDTAVMAHLAKAVRSAERAHGTRRRWWHLRRGSAVRRRAAR